MLDGRKRRSVIIDRRDSCSARPGMPHSAAA
jgi:hypothetical protein